MRESKKTEGTRLPRDSYEDWLGSQTAAPREAEHRNPPEDAYDAWVRKRVEEGEAPPTRSQRREEAPTGF